MEASLCTRLQADTALQDAAQAAWCPRNSGSRGVEKGCRQRGIAQVQKEVSEQAALTAYLVLAGSCQPHVLSIKWQVESISSVEQVLRVPC